jgi:hypothetical protein
MLVCTGWCGSVSYCVQLSAYIFAENLTIYEINVEKYGRTGHATVEKIIRDMRMAIWIAKVTDTCLVYVTLMQYILWFIF